MNEITIFSNPQFGEIRTAIGENGEPMFCLSDVCRVLEISNARDTKSRLSAKGVATTDIPTNGGIQQVTFINEANLYKCIFKSRKKEAEMFQNWVCDEVLPSIRKTGKYEVGYKVPQTFAEALRLAADQQEQIEEQQKLIGAQTEQITALNAACDEMRVKVSYYDQILANPSLILTTSIAQNYGMSAKRFNKLLHELGIQHKVGRQWILYTKYLTEGYAKSEPYAVKNSTTGRVIMQTKWCQKGYIFLYETLKSHGILPLIEREKK